MKHKVRKAVWTDPNDSTKRGVVTQETREYSEGDEVKDKIVRMGEQLAKSMPKHSLGHQNLGWMFIKASSIERQKTFDIEAASVTHLTDFCSFEAAMAIIEQLRQKIYTDFGREAPATRNDLKDTWS